MNTSSKPASKAIAKKAKLTKAAPKRPKKSGVYDEVTPEKQDIGARMREARQIAGLTMTEAALRLGYSQPMRLSLMESGQRMPSMRVVCAVSVLYGTTTDFLLCRVEDSDRDPAAALQRLLAARMSADLQHLAARLASINIETVRKIMPGLADGERLAGLVCDLEKAFEEFRRLNPTFASDMRGSASLARNFDLASEAAERYRLMIDRGRRLTKIRSIREAEHAVNGTGPQLSLLAALEEAS